MLRQRSWQIAKSALVYLTLVEAKRKLLQIAAMKYKVKMPKSIQALYDFLVLNFTIVWFSLTGLIKNILPGYLDT